MELLDLLTEAGEPTGQTKAKNLVHQDGDWHLAAHVWLLNPDGELLLQKRALSKENDPGLWDVSVAGHVSAGETALASAVREVEEEIGLKVAAERLEFLFREKESRILNEGSYLDNEWHEVYLWKVEVDTSVMTLQESEVSDVKWMGLAEFAEKIRNRDSSLVAHWVEYQRLIALVARMFV